MISLLYIDDDDIDRMALGRLLRKFQEIKLTEAATLEEAKQLLQHRDDFDLIITDYHFGIMRLEEFANEFGQKPFFVLSGKEAIEDELGLRQAGMIKNFRKPITLEQIRQVIDWFNGDGGSAEEDAELFGDSYLDHLAEGDALFKKSLLEKLSQELANTIHQLHVYQKEPDLKGFLLLVHQLKYKTTLLDADNTLSICKQAEIELHKNPDPDLLNKFMATITTEVEEMKAFADKMISMG